MGFLNYVQAVELESFDSADITADYQLINTGGLTNPCFLLRIINDSDEAVTISYDGLTDNDVIISDQVLEIAAQTNSSPQNQQCLFKAGFTVYVKGTAGTGSVYVAGYYQPVGS